jgi:predicted PurR-regulated permease PerM
VASIPHRWHSHLLLSGSLILIIASLFWARVVVIPLVLAILLTFILSPLVDFCSKIGLNRVCASVVTVLLALLLFAGISLTMLLQIKNLASDLPHYQEEITAKIVSIRDAGKGSWLEDVAAMIQDISRTVETKGKQPVPVTVETSRLPILQSAAISLLDVLVNVGLVTVLVTFMLIQREDLRNRLIHLWGNGNLTIMTQGLDDAGRRISRFLLMQLLTNAVFALALGLGLFFIGVPYPFVWGLLGGLFRYIPYLGPWLAAIFPVVLSFAVLPGWLPVLSVIGLIVILELIISNFVEPRLYGHSIGVSAVALLIAAAFWAWLWGPVGLILSIPMTACLAVLGKYVPQLGFFHILLGDSLVLEPHVIFYQRLLAGDQEEASDFVEDHLATHPAATVFDDILVPALVLAQRNRNREEITADIHHSIVQITREVVEDIPVESTGEHEPAAAHPILIFGCPARDEADEVGLEMLRRLLDHGKCQMEIVSHKTLSAEVLSRVQEEAPPVLAIGMLPFRKLAHTRYLCKRLRGQFPRLKILVGCWGTTEHVERTRARLLEAGADQVAFSLAESHDQLVPLLQVLQYGESENIRQPAMT